MEEKTEWIFKEKLCFRCCETGHVAKECKVEVTCTKCGSDRHPAFLHKEKNEEELKSNCTSKMVNYGRRVAGIMIDANGKSSKLPTLVECSHIPRDKGEIPNPEIANRFDHLRGIAEEIPPLDNQADVQLLIGRDVPELLKVRAFKNGPKGAPWAQKLDLGWTISGQVCLNRIGGPVHVFTKHTAVSTPDVANENVQLEVSPCPNLFQVKESFGEHTRKSIVKRRLPYNSI
ncbi:hypothetical protein QZH41_013130 [Actinostola sp. cb2023]|nr:hypothetical protein QZH41_013130 [Actinostola sp. cb2023]